VVITVGVRTRGNARAAALGPLAVGLLHASTGGWDIPVTLLLVLCAVELAAGWLAARGRVLPPPGPQPVTG